MSFDGAKVRRIFGLRKRLRKIVCANSRIFDANQQYLICFSFFICTFAAESYYIYK